MQAQIKQEGKGNGGGFFKGKRSHLDLKGGKARLVSGEHCSFSTQSRCEKPGSSCQGKMGGKAGNPKGAMLLGIFGGTKSDSERCCSRDSISWNCRIEGSMCTLHFSLRSSKTKMWGHPLDEGESSP